MSTGLTFVVRETIFNIEMDDHGQHEDLIKGISSQLGPVFKNSTQGIYIYLDESHKVCNEKLSSLLGYSSPEEWAKIEPFAESFVADESQETLVTAYQNAMEKFEGSTQGIVWKKKDGSRITKRVILVPVVYENHPMALHFIS